MKTILFCCVISITVSSCSMSVVQFTENDNFVDVFDDLHGTQDELYLKANRWMIQAFNNAESVVQHSDKEEGVIIGKYLMYGDVSHGAYGTTIDTRVFAIIDIRVRDNKARLEIKPQGSWRYDASGLTVYNYSKQDAVDEINGLAQSLYDYLIKEDIEF